MDTGESEKEEDWVGLPASLAGIKLVDAPVLFFVASHKAFRREFSSIRRSVALAASGHANHGSEFVSDLAKKLEFLKLVYNYHCAAEDEVIFLQLDERVKNVIPSYSLEHACIDENLASIFQILYILVQKDEATPQMFQELLFSLVTVQDMICKHMQKEEQQVFPLLKQKFTSGEQAELVWQYMCSVPVVLLEEFLPWMTIHLSPDEKVEVLDCMKVILPKEQVLQEVVVSWFRLRDGSISNHGNGYRFLNKFFHAKDMLELYPRKILQLDKSGSERIVVEILRNAIHEWHIVVQRDFAAIIEELQQIKSSEAYSTLPSLIVQLKFAADILIFYSNSLEKFLYPLLSESSFFPLRRLVEESLVANLQRLLFCELLNLEQQYVEMLSEALKSLVDDFKENIVYLESEVFLFLSENFSHEMQLWLLYTSLHMMPLGLLMCTVTWFSARLSECQNNSVLRNLALGCPLIDKSFTSLLYEWVRKGSSGKTSGAKFRDNLQQMFHGRCHYLTEKIVQRSVVVSDELPEPNSGFKMNDTLAVPSSNCSVSTAVVTAFYPGEMRLHLLFPTMFKTLSPVEKRTLEPGRSILPSLETRPMDHIFLIHRALIKDLDYLVSLSAKLAENFGFLSEFKSRFNLLHNMYQIHSIAEDEIAFPALESKEALENICNAYSIDHELEVLQFRKIFSILDDISHSLDVSSSETVSILSQLCLKLHECCLSMHRTLSDHIYREEVEIFSRFRGCFSSEEEEQVVGHMLGRLGAENLREMICWLMAYLTVDEQKAITSLWLKVTRHTRFDEWLSEWWEGTAGFSLPVAKTRSSPSSISDPREVLSMYILNEDIQVQKNENVGGIEKEESVAAFNLGSGNSEDAVIVGKEECPSEDFILFSNEIDRRKNDEATDKFQDDKMETIVKESPELSIHDHLIRMNQDDLERVIRKVYNDSTLDGEKKSQFVQNLRMSHWMAAQKASIVDAVPNDEGEILGLCPSYRDPVNLTFGCKHYKRNCKLYAPCCEKLYTCIRCHDELVDDHVLDRKTITKMACMKCLKIQPIGRECTTSSCNGFSMAGYYCSICKLFEDDRRARKIYHCPFCNICRVRKGLEVEYFHCMTCNCCMSTLLFVHACREKCLEDKCSICHEYLFTSNNPVKGLPCGHFMHSACFRNYTCTHLVCPICSKSLGDMQVYFGMIDALMADEKTPEEYADQTQAILCNDCEKRGSAPFHYLYHKCSHCGSYNTRLL